MIKSSWAATVAFLVVLFGGTGFPSPAEAQANFDCRRSQSEAVATICADPEMSALDRRVYEAYRVALEMAEEPNRVRDNHSGWANGIAACGTDRGCLTRALEEELARLEYAARRDQTVVTNPSKDRPVSAGGEEPLEAGLLGEKVPGVVDEGTEVAIADPAVPPASEAANEMASIEAPASSRPTATVEQSQNSTETGILGGGLILAFIVAVLGALLGTKALAEHSMERYRWPMILNWWNVLHVVAVFAFYIGWAFAGPLAGAVVAVGLWLIVTFVNIRKTNLAFGLLISVVQPLVVWVVYAVVALSRRRAVGYDPRG